MDYFSENNTIFMLNGGKRCVFVYDIAMRSFEKIKLKFDSNTEYALFDCHKQRQLVKIQNKLYAVCFHFPLGVYRGAVY